VLELSLTLTALAVLGGIRNHIVFKIRLRRLAEIQASFNYSDPDFFATLHRRYAEFDKQSYNSMMFDLTKWKYEQFYPDPIK